MNKGEKIIAISTFILAVVLGVSQLYLAIENNNLNYKVYQLEEASRRADISILINPNQNWTFTENFTYITLNLKFYNEGERTTLITKIEMHLIYCFSDGTEQTYVSHTNMDDFNMEDYTISPNEENDFTITLVELPTMALNKKTGELVGVFSSRADKVRILVWHNDGVDEQLDYGNSA